MNKVFDYGFTGSFFTNDVEAVSDIERSKMHDLDLSDYMDKNKADVLKDYLKDVPEMSYISLRHIFQRMNFQKMSTFFTEMKKVKSSFL